ncbi:MAG: hypothetical protein ACUVR4_15115, partial [Anaerolineae bacterium]
AFQKKCLGKMGDVAKEGRTVLFVSHNMAAVQNLCSRAILLVEGSVSMFAVVKDVVERYFSSDHYLGADSQSVLKSSLDGSLDLCFISPIDEYGNRTKYAQCGRDLIVGVGLRTTVRRKDVTISLGINNLYDVRVAVLHSRIAGYSLTLAEGEQIIFCRIPQLPLTPGRYWLDFKVYLAGGEVLLWAPHVEQLIVEVGDYYRTGKLPDPTWAGICLLSQEWGVY